MAKTIVDSWVVAPSKNIKRSIEFYYKLGLKPSRRMQDYVEFKVPGGTVLGLYSAEREKIKKHSGSGATGWGIMLRVNNIRKVIADLKRRRIRCATAEPVPDGGSLSYFKDPDGNRLVLLQFGRG
jgi:predicted enzyme related to lactoylglutathione lyase